MNRCWIWVRMGKGSRAAFLFGTLGIAGVIVCQYFRSNKHIRELEAQEMQSMQGIDNTGDR